MALNKSYKNIPLLFGIGAVCFLYGAGYIYVENHFSPLAIIISLIGVLCIWVSIFELRKHTQRSVKLFQWRRYGFILLWVTFSLIFLVGINCLSYRYNLRWDVTKAGQHTLTENTIAVIKVLEQEVKIIAFYVGIPPKYIEDSFREYERLSKGKITTEIIDPIVQIGYAAQFGSVISGKERKVIVRSGGERRDIDFTNQPLTREQLTNAIIRVTRDTRIVYFVTGHGEYDISDDSDNGLSTLVKLLTGNNIETKKLMLGIDKEIPDDCSVLIIAGPRNPLIEKEEDIIKAYIEKGGDALFLIENTLFTAPDKPLSEQEKLKNPTLNNILNHWGIEIADDIVVDLDSHIGGDVGCPATRNYLSHRAIVKNLDYTFYIRPRSISALEERRESIKIAPLVLTASETNSWAETDTTLHVQFDETMDRPGPVPIAYVILEPKGEDKSSDTRIIVFTDADFLTNVFIGQYSNAKMGLNVINWLSELDYQVFLDQKEIRVERLDLTSKQKRMVVVILSVMSILIAISGIMTWLKHNN